MTGPLVSSVSCQLYSHSVWVHISSKALAIAQKAILQASEVAQLVMVFAVKPEKLSSIRIYMVGENQLSQVVL